MGPIDDVPPEWYIKAFVAITCVSIAIALWTWLRWHEYKVPPPNETDKSQKSSDSNEADAITEKTSPGSPAEPIKPAREIAMRTRRMPVWIAALLIVATHYVVYVMYWKGDVAWTFTTIPFTVNFLACSWPALLALFITNNEAGITRPPGWFYRFLDFLPSLSLSLFTFVTAMLATFVFGLPTSVPTPVLTTFSALVFIWTLWAWTIYDLIRNQQPNVHTMLEGYPKLQKLVGRISAGQVPADIGPEPDVVLPPRIFRRPNVVIDEVMREVGGVRTPWLRPDERILAIIERPYRPLTIEGRTDPTQPATPALGGN